MENIFGKLSLTNQQYGESVNGDLVFCGLAFGKLSLGEFDKLFLAKNAQ